MGLFLVWTHQLICSVSLLHQFIYIYESLRMRFDAEMIRFAAKLFSEFVI